MLTFSLTSQIPRTKASQPPQPIILPLQTAWRPGLNPTGTAGCPAVTEYSGSNGFTNPALSIISTSQGGYGYPPDRPSVYGYGPPSQNYLQASGSFASTNQYGLVNLFDNEACSVWQPPFILRNHTSLNVWYYHDDIYGSAASKYVMLDAQIYDQRTGQLSTLGDFGGGINNSPQVVDQNGVRLNAANRGGDPARTWTLASFNLDVVYNTDPDNWFVTLIWVRFDNTGASNIGNAITYFADMRWSYIVSVIHKIVEPSGATLQGTIITDLMVEFDGWSADVANPGNDDLSMKVTMTTWTNGTATNGNNGNIVIYPWQSAITAMNPPPLTLFPGGPTYPWWLRPSGLNLEYQNGSSAASWYLLQEGFGLASDVLSLGAAVCLAGLEAVCGAVGLGLTAISIAQHIYSLLNGLPTNQPSYSWPDPDESKMSYTSTTPTPNYAMTEAYLQVLNFVPSSGINFYLQGTSQITHDPSPYNVVNIDTSAIKLVWSQTKSLPYYAPRLPKLVVCSAPCMSLSWYPTLGALGGMPQPNGVTGYNIYRGTTSGHESFLTSIGNVTSYVDYSVALNMNYYYYITSTGGVSSGRSFEVGGSTFGGCHLCESPTH